VQPCPEDLREIAPTEEPYDEAYVWFVFRLDESERKQVLQKAATKIFGYNSSSVMIEMGDAWMNLDQFVQTRSEVIYRVDLLKPSKTWSYFCLPEGKSQTLRSLQKLKESAPAGAIQIQIGSTKLDARTFKLLSVPEDFSHDHLVQSTPEDLNDLVGATAGELFKDKLPATVMWSYRDEYLLPSQINLQNFAANPLTCVPLKHMFALAGQDDVAKAVADAGKRPNGTRNMLNRIAEVTTQHMLKVWPEHKGLKIRLLPNGPHVDATIEDTFNTFDFARRSDGFKRFISFLLLISAKAQADDLSNTLYLHDEPEISLHPSGARYVRDELIVLSKKNYVVYSTHSIFMIDRENIDRHLIVKKKNEITTLVPADTSNVTDEEVLYNALGYSVFEMLKPTNIVFEGWRDKTLFKVALSRVPREFKELKERFQDVGTCHAKGVKNVAHITALLELANRRAVILTDGDEVACEHQTLFDGFGEWIRYDEMLPSIVTGEDLVTKEAFIEAIAAARAKCADLPSHDDLVIPDTGRTGVLTRWLWNKGVTKDRAKQLVNAVKDELFTNLKPSQVLLSYFTLLSSLSKRLPN
jgi:hypothetical protein